MEIAGPTGNKGITFVGDTLNSVMFFNLKGGNLLKNKEIRDMEIAGPTGNEGITFVGDTL